MSFARPSVPDLLFITNPDNGDSEEDLFLGEVLDGTFHVTYGTPKTAIEQLPRFCRCLIRNAWPSRSFSAELQAIKEISARNGIRMYNPVHRGYVEDKRYIVRLWNDGYPVIPTVNSIQEIDRLPTRSAYVIKPIDGCSSLGVERLSREELIARNPDGYVIQPEIDLKDEISFYFIDDAFAYAMVSAGKDRRWELTEYQASPREVEWAMRFVRWNAMPYGIQRIDAARTHSGELLLMEVEDQMCFLSLLDLSETTRGMFCDGLKRSLLKHLVLADQ